MSKHQAPKKLSSRRIAYEVMLGVDQNDSYANLLLPTIISKNFLSQQDAAFTTELCYGTLRMQGFYDAVIANAAARDISKIDLQVLIVLRLGVHQLLNMRVPEHAAVFETVKLAQSVIPQSAIGFINAVLRRVQRHNIQEWQDFLLADMEDPVEKLAVLYSHPAWIVRAFAQSLKQDGREDDLEALLKSDNVNPIVTYVTLPDVPGEIPENTIPTQYSPYGFTLEHSSDPFLVAGVKEGNVRVQDEGSQLAALVLANANEQVSTEKWLDLCAGPGGKAALLASLAQKMHSQLTANEIVPARAGLVEQALKPFKNVSVLCSDGITFGDTHSADFDRVMVDAPCSGLGALRRRPEARWRKQPSDIAALSALQEKLLKSAVKYTLPGGHIAYVTCSPHVAETRAIVDKILRTQSSVTEIDTRPLFNRFVSNPLPHSKTHLSTQLWPHIHGTDAMFISILKKSE